MAWPTRVFGVIFVLSFALSALLSITLTVDSARRRIHVSHTPVVPGLRYYGQANVQSFYPFQPEVEIRGVDGEKNGTHARTAEHEKGDVPGDRESLRSTGASPSKNDVEGKYHGENLSEATTTKSGSAAALSLSDIVALRFHEMMGTSPNTIALLRGELMHRSDIPSAAQSIRNREYHYAIRKDGHQYLLQNASRHYYSIKSLAKSKCYLAHHQRVSGLHTDLPPLELEEDGIHFLSLSAVDEDTIRRYEISSEGFFQDTQDAFAIPFFLLKSEKKYTQVDQKWRKISTWRIDGEIAKSAHWHAGYAGQRSVELLAVAYHRRSESREGELEYLRIRLYRFSRNWSAINNTCPLENMEFAEFSLPGHLPVTSMAIEFEGKGGTGTTGSQGNDMITVELSYRRKYDTKPFRRLCAKMDKKLTDTFVLTRCPSAENEGSSFERSPTSSEFRRSCSPKSNILEIQVGERRETFDLTSRPSFSDAFDYGLPSHWAMARKRDSVSCFAHTALSPDGSMCALADNMGTIFIFQRSPAIVQNGELPCNTQKNEDEDMDSLALWRLWMEISSLEIFSPQKMKSMQFIEIPGDLCCEGPYSNGSSSLVRLAILYERGGLATVRIDDGGHDTAQSSSWWMNNGRHFNEDYNDHAQHREDQQKLNHFGNRDRKHMDNESLQLWEVVLGCLCLVLFLATSALRFDRYFQASGPTTARVRLPHPGSSGPPSPPSMPHRADTPDFKRSSTMSSRSASSHALDSLVVAAPQLQDPLNDFEE